MSFEPKPSSLAPQVLNIARGAAHRLPSLAQVASMALATLLAAARLPLWPFAAMLRLVIFRVNESPASPLCGILHNLQWSSLHCGALSDSARRQAAIAQMRLDTLGVRLALSIENLDHSSVHRLLVLGANAAQPIDIDDYHGAYGISPISRLVIRHTQGQSQFDASLRIASSLILFGAAKSASEAPSLNEAFCKAIYYDNFDLADIILRAAPTLVMSREHCSEPR